MSWIKDLISPQTRKWEDFYRSRWQYDKVVRSSHGVNCTGGCSWNIHVKDGIVVWETQAIDYPILIRSCHLMNHEAVSVGFLHHGTFTARSGEISAHAWRPA